MTDAEKIHLVRNVAACSEKATRAVNSQRGVTTALAREKRAIRALLVALLGRAPSDAEIASATPGGVTPEDRARRGGA